MAGDGGAGLVKKLLFPGYADAGANDAFSNTGKEIGDVSDSNGNDMEDLTTQSDATTAIHDNRTQSKPQEHEVQYDYDGRVGGYAPSSLSISALTSRIGDTNLNDSLVTETGAGKATTATATTTRATKSTTAKNNIAGEKKQRRQPPPTPPSSSRNKTRFFPSTNPASEIVSNEVVGPESPPSMIRRGPPARSISTTVRVGGGKRISPRSTIPFPSTSPIKPQPPPPPPPPPQQQQSQPNEEYKTNSNSILDESSIAVTTASSGAVSSILGIKLLDRKDEMQGEIDDEKMVTPIKSNVSNLDNTTKKLQNLEEGNKDKEQTQIRPITEEILKQRDLELQKQQKSGFATPDVLSEANSNISEFGTMVEAPSRLADVEQMASLLEAKENFEVSGIKITTPVTTTPADEHILFGSCGSSDTENNEDAFKSESNFLTTNGDNLSLPTLTTTSRNDIGEFNSMNQHCSLLKETSEKGEDCSTDNSSSNYNAPAASASAMVSAALRRLGSRSSPRKASYSTPQTPTLSDYFTGSNSVLSGKQQRQSASASSRNLQQSFSFESSFGISNSSRKHPLLSPRFSKSFTGPDERDQKSSSDGIAPMPTFSSKTSTSSAFRQHASSLASPLRFASSCLSVDTALDECDDLASLHRFPLEPYPSVSEPSKAKVSLLSPRKSSSRHQNTFNLYGRDRSKSWDIGSSHSGGQVQHNSTTAESAFRKSPAGGRSSRIRPRSVKSSDDTAPETTRLSQLSNFSPATPDTHNAVALRTPHRVEIEREDALDLLTCLVERSAQFDRANDELSCIQEKGVDIDEEDSNYAPPLEVGESDVVVKDYEEIDDSDEISTFAETGGGVEPQQDEVEISENAADLSVPTNAIETLRLISQHYENNTTSSCNEIPGVTGINHDKRMKALDELLRSQTYAVEMKRATTSASAWLRSVQRTVADETTFAVSPGNKNGFMEIEKKGAEKGNREAIKNENDKKEFEKVDLLTMKAMLHSAELKAKEQEERSEKLNEELSKCRAEIGRLKTSSSRGEKRFRSPNRSILDDDDDSTVSEQEPIKAVEDTALLESMVGGDTSPILETSLDDSGEAYTGAEPSFCRSDRSSESNVEHERWEKLAEAKREAVALKAALAQANSIIQRLYVSSCKEQGEAEINAEQNDVVPTVDIDNPELEKELDEYKDALKNSYDTKFSNLQLGRIQSAESTSPLDRRTINVRMLDGENFITEWDSLSPPLPPPPDHGLRSPIVRTLLDDWTRDQSLQSSLLSWMDIVMDGASPKDIPPLTISSLNHQIRDGFTMHVLPLLLRRSDIHVDVTTRAHRNTSYDLAVTIKPSTGADGIGKGNPETMSKSVTLQHNKKVTTKKHLMAYKASHGENHMIDESMIVDNEQNSQVRSSKGPGNVADYLRTGSLFRSSDNEQHGSSTGSVSHSAVTTQITNSTRLRSSNDGGGRLLSVKSFGSSATTEHSQALGTEAVEYQALQSLMGDDGSVGSSLSRGSQRSGQHQQQHQQSSIMGALGGAFGGLLGTRKTKAPPMSPLRSFSYDDDGVIPPPTPKRSNDVPPFLRPPNSPTATTTYNSQAPERVSNDPNQNHQQQIEQEPYHRVVSAPPGRIGVTFVEYRGHAVVSDVYKDSPLFGWIFSSDILIAIDEIPVSGMRVRDIVDILTKRKERQRALRVISSQGMSEQLNATAVSEVN